jgi:ABC-type transport system substrate-binding protein
MRGEVDAAQEISREAIDFMERSSQIQTFASPQPFYVLLMLNHTRGPLANPEVRRALSHALDRQQIVDGAMRGRGTPAAGPIWRLHWAYDGAEPHAFDPGKAAQMLERAGYPLVKGSANEPDRRMSFRCLLVNEDPQYERIALLVQRQLFDIGVHVELVPLSLRDLAERAGLGDFDTILAPANAGRTLMFTHLSWRSPERGAGTMFRTGYSGVDQALDRLRSSTTDEAVRTAVAHLGERFRTDAPALFIAWTELTRAVSDRISVGENPPPDPFMSLWEWRRRPSGAIP